MHVGSQVESFRVPLAIAAQSPAERGADWAMEDGGQYTVYTSSDTGEFDSAGAYITIRFDSPEPSEDEPEVVTSDGLDSVSLNFSDLPFPSFATRVSSVSLGKERGDLSQLATSGNVVAATGETDGEYTSLGGPQSRVTLGFCTLNTEQEPCEQSDGVAWLQLILQDGAFEEQQRVRKFLMRQADSGELLNQRLERLQRRFARQMQKAGISNRQSAMCLDTFCALSSQNAIKKKTLQFVRRSFNLPRKELKNLLTSGSPAAKRARRLNIKLRKEKRGHMQELRRIFSSCRG